MSQTSDFLCFEGKSGDNFVIPSIIQFLSLLNKSGRLTFWLSQEASASMYLYEGNLTHTELNKLGGIDVISHMFCWSYGNGKFEFRSDYTGEKILYKSLGKLVPQQILMRVMQRTDECSFREEIHSKFKSVSTSVSLDTSKITSEETNDPIKSKMIQKVKDNERTTLSDLITDVLEGEIDSCRIFHELLQKGIFINSENWDKPLTQKHLLEVMNIISRYTDQSIALKFLADKKAILQLTQNDTITIRKLKKLSVLAQEEFTKLLPQAQTRWVELKNSINEYINKIETMEFQGK